MNDKISIEDLIGYLSGKLTSKESNVVEEWINASDMNRSYFKELQQAWRSQKHDIELSAMEIERSWEYVRSKTIVDTDTSKRILPRFIWRYAAALVASISIGYLSYYYFQYGSDTKHIEQASSSQTKEVVLADGTHVWLNKSSSISYDDDFNGSQRMVQLAGEAYFDVQRNPDKPFVVRSENMLVKVLGTSFNINNRKKSDQQIVSVISGIVAVSDSNNSDNKVQLTKNENAVFERNTGKVTKSVQHDPNVLAWKTGILTFQKSSLQTVVSTLENYFDVEFNVSEDIIDNYQFTSTFDNRSIEEILQVLEVSLNLTIEITGQTITVKQ